MIPSPCVKRCQMDAASGLCLGCYRHIDEITVWAGADDARRAVILAAVAARRAALAVDEAPVAPSPHG